MSAEEHHPGAGAAFSFKEGAVQLTVDTRVYRLVAVQKTAYKLAERCTAILGILNDTTLPLTLVFRPGTAEHDALESVRIFFQELTDQELREHVGDQTRAVRALIIAQAFSKTDLIRRD